ncbi:Crp/Fnr family transcriptional regulator [Tenacibaculum holothuriorum]|uniref:Crp/Fnr family transcriptional regulator n=1 Tax=Tenacibaculum holothuriorum TaxID=1635173 RepID=A0A1Y2P8Q1_9FLAO|nr:Crp/Fnr family transcriptional regulator [Tenacibaculum holothuriorum]OSY86824.1 Crp/Fnr family transcriptional regulator [Tenacibaculum holothuriorum]
MQNFVVHYQNLFERPLLEEIQNIGQLKHIVAEDIIIDINTPIQFIPLIINGAVKVLKEDEMGDELLLYYIERGSTCTMTLSCCVNKAKSKVRAIAETDVDLVMIPIQKMEEWMMLYKSWQEFILQSYHNRMDEMLQTIDTIAFNNMHNRVFKYLQEKAKVHQTNSVNVTHQEIANELHTSRVVISRILKALKIEEKIKLHRNHIELLE